MCLLYQPSQQDLAACTEMMPGHDSWLSDLDCLHSLQMQHYPTASDHDTSAYLGALLGLLGQS